MLVCSCDTKTICPGPAHSIDSLFDFGSMITGAELENDSTNQNMVGLHPIKH